MIQMRNEHISLDINSAVLSKVSPHHLRLLNQQVLAEHTAVLIYVRMSILLTLPVYLARALFASATKRFFLASRHI